MNTTGQGLRIVQVDAFADRPFTGNPAAVMLLQSWLPDGILQAIAAENNLAETAFTVPVAGGDADYELRWFTPEAEVTLCGHATLASGHVLLGDRNAVRFSTRNAGLLGVRREGAGYALSLPAWAPHAKALPDHAAAMGGTVLETAWHDAGYAVYRYPNEAAVRALSPDLAALRPHGFIVHIATAPGVESDIVSRVFVPGGGIPEDPVTGSAHCVIAPWWAVRLGRTEISAFQASARGGHLGCRVEGDRVILTGRCRTVIEGEFLL